MDTDASNVTFEDILARDGRLVYKTRGVSMEPMLRQNRDLVMIEVPSSRLQKYDVALYKRGKTCCLHRVIKVKENAYLIRGDNTFVLETVPDDAVIGVLEAFQRKGKDHKVTEKGYLIYVRFWQLIYPLRALCYSFRKAAGRAARQLGILPLIKKVLGKGGM